MYDIFPSQQNIQLQRSVNWVQMKIYCYDNMGQYTHVWVSLWFKVMKSLIYWIKFLKPRVAPSSSHCIKISTLQNYYLFIN